MKYINGPPFFSAQLWIQDGDKLVNKAFSSWKFDDTEWIGIPTNPGDFGYLKDKSQTDTDMLLTPDKYWQAGTWHHFGGNEVILNKKTTTVSYKERQKWIRGTSDADGYFYLEHKVSGTYLTAQKDNVLTVNSKFEKFSKYVCISTLLNVSCFVNFIFSAHRSRWSHHWKGKYQTLMTN